MAFRQSVPHPDTSKVLLGESEYLANDIVRWRQAAQPILRQIIDLTDAHQPDHYPVGAYQDCGTVPLDPANRILMAAKALRENEYPIGWSATHPSNAGSDYAQLLLFRDRRVAPDIGPIFGLQLGNSVSRTTPALEEYADLMLRGDLHAYYFDDLLSGYYKIRRVIRHFSDEPDTWVRKGFLTSVLLRSARKEPYRIPEQAGRDAAKYEELRSEGEEPFSAKQVYALAAQAIQGWSASVRHAETTADGPTPSGNVVLPALPHQRKPEHADDITVLSSILS